MTGVPDEFIPDEEKVVGCICVACGKQSLYGNWRDGEWFCPVCHVTEDPHVEGGHPPKTCPECGQETTYRHDDSDVHITTTAGITMDSRGWYICPGYCGTVFDPGRDRR